jgi:hypothetical protein
VGAEGKHIARLNTLTKVAQRNSAVEGGAHTSSPSMPVMHSGKGVLWATAKSSTTWLGVVFEGLETQDNKRARSSHTFAR